MMLNYTTPIDESTNRRIYSILVETCGASPEEYQTHGFADYFRDGYGEWRFIGNLGFGGKIYASGSHWFVSCYPEDRTPEATAMIDEANRRLAALREEWVAQRGEVS